MNKPIKSPRRVITPLAMATQVAWALFASLSWTPALAQGEAAVCVSVGRLDSVNHKKNTTGFPNPDAVLLAGPFTHAASLSSSDLKSLVRKAIEKERKRLGIVSYEGNRVAVDTVACVSETLTLEDAMQQGEISLHAQEERFKTDSFYSGWVQKVDKIDGPSVNVATSQTTGRTPTASKVQTPAGDSGALYTTLIAKAREMIEKGQAANALKAASDAIRVNGDDHRGHYYSAMALMQMGRADDAAAQAAMALERAPDTAKAGVAKLAKLIEDGKKVLAFVAAAERADAAGSYEAAATAYESAYLVNADADMAVKAAKIWINKLKNPIRAAKLLRIPAGEERRKPGSHPEATIAEINDLLKGTSDELARLAQAKVTLAKTQNGGAALSTLNSALEASPGSFDAHDLKLKLLAKADDVNGFATALQAANQDSFFMPSALAREAPNLGRFAKNASFMSFLETLGERGIAFKAELNKILVKEKEREQESIQHAADQKEKFQKCARDASRLAGEIEEDSRRIEIAKLKADNGSLSSSEGNSVRKDHASLGRRISSFKDSCSSSFDEVSSSDKSSICSHPAYQSTWCSNY